MRRRHSTLDSRHGRFRDELIAIIILLLTGGVLQAYSNRTAAAVVFVVIFGIVGLVFIRSLCGRATAEQRAFLLTYAVCVFAGGVAQCYSSVAFGMPQSTVDANTFLAMIAPSPPWVTMSDTFRFLESTLPVFIWQQCYKAAYVLGAPFGPYVAVTFNAAVIGVTGSVTVRIAREIFGDDEWRLRRVRILFASCGLFILFGAILLRDCFALSINVVILWLFVRWFRRQTVIEALIACVALGAGMYVMEYLRPGVALLMATYLGLAALALFTTRVKRIPVIMATIIGISVILLSTSLVFNYLSISRQLQTQEMLLYSDLSAYASGDSSLGMRLIINQPLPVRIVFGTAAMAISPIPLWANFNGSGTEYHWIKGYNGFYQVIVLPLIILGVYQVLRARYIPQSQLVVWRFMVGYLVVNTVAVVATSMEQRHLAQFLPAAVVLAVLPDLRDARIRNKLRNVWVGWMAIVICVHVFWGILKISV